MKVLGAIVSLLIAIVGWYYTFDTHAAEKLATVENAGINRLRIRLRRAGGCAMMALAICFFAGFYTVDFRDQPHAFVAIWIAVIALLATLVVLALVDLRLTSKLRRRRGQPPDRV